MTYREQFDSAMKCTTKDEADKWLVTEVLRYEKEYEMRPGKATEVILCNLGYMAGYYSEEVSKKVLNLFGAAHPIFGTTRPSTEEAFQLEKQVGQP